MHYVTCIVVRGLLLLVLLKVAGCKSAAGHSVNAVGRFAVGTLTSGGNPVAGAQNAAILAVQMLALSDDRLAEAMTAYKGRLVEQVEAKDARARERLESEGLS